MMMNYSTGEIPFDLPEEVDDCKDILKSNLSKPENTTGDKELYENVYYVLYGYGLPTICVCGFLGNVMNLIILAGKQVHRSLRRAEHAANIGLIALAVADLIFCITAFPSTFLPKDGVFYDTGFLTYYGCYCAAVISIFMLTSTWLTVAMSTERYLAICHPLKSRKILSIQRTKVAIVMVYILSALFNIPVFWRYSIVQKKCNNQTLYTVNMRLLGDDGNLENAYRACWAVVGNFIPLLLLLFFNICLMREIHRSYAMRKRMGNGHCSAVHHHSNDTEASNRITITLISIVVMFFILVAPSEILKQIAFLFGSDLSKNYTYLTIEIITNVMQTINFSANFILYCIINPSFRRTMKEMFCFQYQKLHMDGATEVGSQADSSCPTREKYASLRVHASTGGTMRLKNMANHV
uniref:Orphan G-protein coupled receptor 51 n=1 Tax=Platynereis dumerilii TaxID=6359 RepID=A0A0K0PUJ6_PLADU|nr:orphan G-protein coupled receptor 51 [Platynereis dumerilii]